MRPQDIKIGEYYRHRQLPPNGRAKALEILKPGMLKNIRAVFVKCEWSVNKDDNLRFIKYFRPRDLVKEKVE
jgi:hypothetical protein